MEKLLVIARVWPEPESSAAGRRLLQLIRILSGFFEIMLVSAAEKSAHSYDFSQSGIREAQVRLNDEGFNKLLLNFRPDIVLFERFMIEEQFGWRVRETLPDALAILDTEDLHFLRQARARAVRENRAFKDEDLYSETAKREVASILRCDLSLMISQTEQDILHDKMQIPRGLLHYIPLLHDALPGENPGFDEREHFLFIGNGFHEPNLDAIRVLKSEIWPRIRKSLPQAELHIYGAYLPESVLQLHQQKDAFLIKGRAESLSQVMRKSRVLLAPLRFGAGQKGKLLDAMEHGLPSLTTAIGAESMNGALLWPGSITDDWDSFAREAVDLHQNCTIWEQAALRSRTVLEERFNPGLFRDPLMARIREIQSRLNEHRQRHFFGQVLQLNTVNSYKYLSRWIAEKSKKD